MRQSAPSRRRPPFGRSALGWAAAACLLAGAAPAMAATYTWTGEGTTNNWSNAGNWSGTGDIPNYSTLQFGGTRRLNPVNNLWDPLQPFIELPFSVNGLSFLAGAGAFNLSGNEIYSRGHITNLSSNLQTLSLPVSATSNNQTWDGGTAGMRFIGEMALGTINLTVRNNVEISNGERPFRIGDGNGGDASMSLFSGSSLSFATAANLTVGYQSGNRGTLTVSGAGSAVSRVDMLSVGYARVPAGSIDFGSSTGTVIVSNNASLSTINTRIGDYGGGVNINGSGTVTLDSGAGWTNTGLISVGRGSQGTLGIGGAAVVSTATMRVGDNATRGGTVNVAGPGSMLQVLGALSVGHNGNGSLLAATSATIQSASADIGYQETGGLTATGSAVLNTGSSWVNTGRLTVGLGGTGELILNAGSRLDTGEVLVGTQNASTGRGRGTLTVDGGQAFATSLRMGSDGASLNVRNGGSVRTSSSVMLGTGGGDDTVSLRMDSLGWLEVAPTQSGAGFFAGNSDIELRSRSTLDARTISLASNPGTTTTMRVQNDGSLVDTRFMDVGAAGAASLTLKDRAIVRGDRWGEGTLIVGRDSGSSGAVGLSESSSLQGFGSVVVGASGTGSLSIAGGSYTHGRHLTIGANTGGSGTVVVGDNSVLSQYGSLTVGGAGEGRLSITRGSGPGISRIPGAVSAGRLEVGARGRVTLEAGRLDYSASHDDTLAAGGVFDWREGTVGVYGSTDLTRSNAFLRGAMTGSQLQLSAGRELLVTGDFDIGNQRLHIDGGRLQVGTLKLAGGVVTTSPGAPIDMAAGQVLNLSGFGTVAAAITGGGGGTAVRSRITAEGGNLALGQIDNPTGFGFSGDVEVRANSQLLLLSASKALLGGNVTLRDRAVLATLNMAELSDSGTLRTTGSAWVQGRFTNHGTVDGGTTGVLTFLNDVYSTGLFRGNVSFRASHVPGQGAQRQSFGGGNVRYEDTAVLTLDLMGPAAGTGYDQLADIDQLGFDGHLNLVFGNGFAPAEGSVLQLFEFQGFSGSFDDADISVYGFDRTRLDFSRLSVDGSLSVTAVPEPGTWAMWSAGLLALVMHSRRRGLAPARQPDAR